MKQLLLTLCAVLYGFSALAQPKDDLVFTVNGPDYITVGTTATFTAVGPANVTGYLWSFEEGSPSLSTGETVTTVWNTPGTYEVKALALGQSSGIVSKMVTVYACDVSTLPWLEDFERPIGLDCWTVYDIDGDGHSWVTSEDMSNSISFSGSNAIGSASWIYGNGALTPNNWIVSPQITLPAEGNIVLAWMEMANHPSDYTEHYALYISTNGPDLFDFSKVWEGTVPSGQNWRQVTQSLNAYRGQTIHIAFRHYNCTDLFWLVLDDIRIAKTYTVDVTSADPSVGTVSGGGTFMQGNNTYVSASVTNPCYRFSYWEKNGSMFSQMSTITVSSDATLVAHFENKWTSYEEVTACGSYTWSKTGVTYNKSGKKYHTSVSSDGCPIRDTLKLTFVDHWGGTEQETSCGPFFWYKTLRTYNQAGKKYYTGTAEDGCPIRDTLELTLIDHYGSNETVTSCGPYYWAVADRTYNKGGKKVYNGTAGDGCPIRDTLNLTVVDHYGTNTVVTSCGPYVWDVNGKTYNKGGKKTYTGTAEDGCPIRDTLTLTVVDKYSSYTKVTNCGPYYWDKTDQTYNKSGKKYYKATAEDGCPIRDTLELTVYPSPTSYNYVENCGPYTWTVNGKTYNKSGVKTNKGTTDHGCPIYDTIELLIVTEWVNYTYVENCGPYTWATNGRTYNKSGIKTYKGTAADGCPIRDTLDLTIVDKWTSYQEIENCGPFTWWTNGKTYNKGGIKTYKGVADDGCPVYDTIYLNIVDKWTSYTYDTCCGPYTWWVNDKTYNKSGVKVAKGVAEDGCPTYDTLHLTIVDRWTSHAYVTNCGPYTWPVNGTTYNKSGVKTYKGTAEDGCPTYDTLTLTINNCNKNPENNSQFSTLNSQLSIYPNPTTGLVNIDVKSNSQLSNLNSQLTVEVLDLVGRRVALFENSTTLDLSGLADGTYTLRITMPDGVAVRKVVKK